MKSLKTQLSSGRTQSVVGLDLGTATKLGSRNVGTTRHGSGHGCITSFPTAKPDQSYFTSQAAENIAG